MNPIITLDVETERFKRALLAYGRKKKVDLAGIIRKVAHEIHRNLLDSATANQYGTPADTSNARGNWRLRRVGRYTWRLSNNTKYIRLLEYGGYRGKGAKTTTGKPPWTRSYVSRQAPRGMLRRNIRLAAQMILKMARGV